MASQKDVQGYTGFAVKKGEISSYLSKALAASISRQVGKNNMEQEKKINLYPEHLINKKGVGEAIGLAGFSEYFCHSIESFQMFWHVIHILFFIIKTCGCKIISLTIKIKREKGNKHFKERETRKMIPEVRGRRRAREQESTWFTHKYKIIFFSSKMQ